MRLVRTAIILVLIFASGSFGQTATAPAQASAPALTIGPDKIVPATTESSAPARVAPPQEAKPSEAAPIPNPNAPIPNPNAPVPLTAPKTAGAPPPPAAPTEAAVQPQRSAAASSADIAASAGTSKKPYVIGPLDVLEIKVWNDGKLSGMYDVRPDGYISMFLIGELQASGYTVDQLRQSILLKLGTVLNNPEVNIQVARINSKKYYVYGEVGRAGEFPLTADITVLDALSNTGGFREFANPKKIYILRGSKKFNFNYKDVSRGKNLDQNILVENGDRIFVP